MPYYSERIILKFKERARFTGTQKSIEKSRECHNHKPQPTHDTKRKKKRQKHVQNKQTNAREAHRTALSSPSEVITMLKRMKKHEDKEHGKTLKQEAPRSINHKATQNKNNSGTTALERSVAKNTGV